MMIMIIITLSTNLKSRFTREIIWNKYRSQMSTGEESDNTTGNEYTTGSLLDYDYFKKYYKLIATGPTFANINRSFVLAYQNADDRQSFSQFYLPRIMVKDFNVIIDRLAFFDLPIKTEEEAYEKNYRY